MISNVGNHNINRAHRLTGRTKQSAAELIFSLRVVQAARVQRAYGTSSSNGGAIALPPIKYADLFDREMESGCP